MNNGASTTASNIKRDRSVAAFSVDIVDQIRSLTVHEAQHGCRIRTARTSKMSSRWVCVGLLQVISVLIYALLQLELRSSSTIVLVENMTIINTPRPPMSCYGSIENLTSLVQQDRFQASLSSQFIAYNFIMCKSNLIYKFVTRQFTSSSRA